MDGLLTAVFDAFSLKEEPQELLAEGDALPLFCDHTYHVTTDEEKARRVWTGLEKKLTREALKLISVSWLSELRELNTPLFLYICKVFKQGDISRNFASRRRRTAPIWLSSRQTITCCPSSSTIFRTALTTSRG